MISFQLDSTLCITLTGDNELPAIRRSMLKNRNPFIILIFYTTFPDWNCRYLQQFQSIFMQSQSWYGMLFHELLFVHNNYNFHCFILLLINNLISTLICFEWHMIRNQRIKFYKTCLSQFYCLFIILYTIHCCTN